MQVIHVYFQNDSTVMAGEFNLILPEKEAPRFQKDNPHYKRPRKTLVLLHGFSGDCNEWLYHAPVMEYAEKYNLAIVMPSGGLNFYLDCPETGRSYDRFIGKDLIEYLRDTFGLAMTREDTLIGGLSMGGFGALHVGLSHPDVFSRIIALSSAFLIPDLKTMPPQGNGRANYEYYRATFGDLSVAAESDQNPEVLHRKLKESGAEIPRIFMACGTEDFLYTRNLGLRDTLLKQGADLEYREGPGVHDWHFWVPYLDEGIRWFLE